MGRTAQLSGRMTPSSHGHNAHDIPVRQVAVIIPDPDWPAPPIPDPDRPVPPIVVPEPKVPDPERPVDPVVVPEPELV